jgi:hypothetical protein
MENESILIQIPLVIAYQESDFAFSALAGTLAVSLMLILGVCARVSTLSLKS